MKGDRPNHIAIVLDGNRRWAKRNLVMQKQGHFKGADTVENLLDWCEEFDIKIITLYVLSAENLDRKNEELEYLYDLIKTRLEKLYNDPRIHKNEMRVKKFLLCLESYYNNTYQQLSNPKTCER